MRSHVLGTLAAVLALLTGYGVMQMGNTLQGTLLSVRGGVEGFSPTEIGLVSTGFSLGLMVGSLVAPRLIRRAGHARSFAALASVSSAAALLHLMFVDPQAWMAFRALTGFCFAGLFIAVESWLNGAATPAIRGQILGFYAMTGLLAGVLGQLMLPLADPTGYMLFCVVSVIISLGLVPVLMTRSTPPGSGGAIVRLDFRRLYRQSPFGLVAAFLCGIGAGAFFALGPYLGQRIGLSEGGIAMLMASGTLGAFAMTWPLGWLSDRMDRRALAVGIALLGAVTVLAMVVALPSGLPEPVLYALTFVFGGVVLPTYNLVVAHVNDSVSPEEFVAASGGLVIVQGAGAATGPVLGGMMMNAVGNPGLGMLIAGSQFLVAAWGVYRMRQRAAPEDKEQFQPVPFNDGIGTELIEAAQQPA